MSKIVPGTLVCVWSGLLEMPTAFSVRTFEHITCLVVSVFRDESKYVNRGTRGTGYSVNVVFKGEYEQVFLEDDDERYLWSVISYL